MKIIVFSDLHYYGEDLSTAKFNLVRKMSQYAVPMLDKLIEKINNVFKPDVVVNLGDTIEDSGNYEKDLRALSFIAEKMKSINCPCYTILGNHDMKIAETTKDYERIFGYKNFTQSVDINGYHLVFLNTEVRPQYGLDKGGSYKTQHISDADLKWLSKDLDNNKNPYLVFSHYMLAEEEVYDEENDGWMMIKNRDMVKKIYLEGIPPLAVVSGHRHSTYTLTEDGINYHVVGSLTACKTENGIPDGTFFEIDLFGNNVCVKKHRIFTQELGGEISVIRK